MSSNHNVTRHFATALVAALLVLVPALGCGGDDEGSANDARLRPRATGSTGTGIENLQEAQAQLCPELSDLSADLAEVSTSGTDAGQDALARIGSAAATLAASATALTQAGADDAATAAEDLSSSLKSLATSGGEDAQARAGEAADGVQQLSDALQCP